MIHRAPFGSLERFVAILLEHTAGKFPLWLSPQQYVVLPISEKYAEYADSIHQSLSLVELNGEVDHRDEKIGRKIRDAEVNKIPFMLIVGDKEASAGTVSVRQQGVGDIGSFNGDELIAFFARETEKSLSNNQE
jgi:threonyl-tRNA synthetase